MSSGFRFDRRKPSPQAARSVPPAASGRAEPPSPDAPVVPAPVSPGAWNTRSRTLVDATDGLPPESGPEPLGGGADHVVWPEAGRGEGHAQEADGVPLAQPPTGPLRSVARSEGRSEAPRKAAGSGTPGTGDVPFRRARTTPRAAPRPAPPAPGTRLDSLPGMRATRSSTPSAQGTAPAGGTPGKRVPGGSADPVRELMHRHRVLCERAVDPLEIAAGLEAHGITDRTAARYRHRDVFSLAEELYVRVPRADTARPPAGAEAAGSPAVRGPRSTRSVGRALSHLLPGLLCAATLAGLTYVPQTPPYARPAVGALGALTVLAAVRLSLRDVPRSRTAGLWACWLLGYVLYGDWLLTELIAGGVRADRLLPAVGCLCAPLALAFGVAPAAWCAHLFAVRARRRLTASRSLGDFAAGVRPLLVLAVGLFTLSLLTVQGAAHLAVRGAAPPHAGQAATVALGVLFFAALLLSAHGFPRAASAGLAAACLLVAVALGSVLAARLPGMAVLGRPVEHAVAGYGPTVVPVTACAVAALALLGYALRVLTGASAHEPDPPDPSTLRPAARERR